MGRGDRSKRSRHRHTNARITSVFGRTSRNLSDASETQRRVDACRIRACVVPARPPVARLIPSRAVRCADSGASSPASATRGMATYRRGRPRSSTATIRPAATRFAAMVTAVIWTRLSKPPDTRSAHGCWKQRRRDAQAVERPETPLPLKRAQTVGLDDDGGGECRRHEACRDHARRLARQTEPSEAHPERGGRRLPTAGRPAPRASQLASERFEDSGR